MLDFDEIFGQNVELTLKLGKFNFKSVNFHCKLMADIPQADTEGVQGVHSNPSRPPVLKYPMKMK